MHIIIYVSVLKSAYQTNTIPATFTAKLYLS